MENAKKYREELMKQKETLTGKENKKKRAAINKKIKAVNDSLKELEADTSVEKSIMYKLEQFREKKSSLKGAENKKKRATINKKIKNLEKELANLQFGPMHAEAETYEPPLPDNWLSSQNPELRQYEKRLTQVGAARLVKMTAKELKEELNIKKGAHRLGIIKVIRDLEGKLNWMPPLKEPFIKQTVMHGDRQTFPQDGDELSVLYRGTLRADPEVTFDQNQDRNNPFTFTVGQGKVIPGWEHGLPKLSLLEKARLTIRSDYAYGARALPKIPPLSDLIFEVDLIGIKRNGVELKPVARGSGNQKRKTSDKEEIAAPPAETEEKPEEVEPVVADIPEDDNDEPPELVEAVPTSEKAEEALPEDLAPLADMSSEV